MSQRKKIPDITQFRVLYESARRCCLCFGLHNDYSIKKGQIAHLDQNSSNDSFDNLVWLCLLHHDEYDSKGSQTKNYAEFEVKKYRQVLYGEVNRQRLIPIGNDTVEKVRFKSQLIKDNLALFFFAAYAMYEPLSFRDLLLKEVKDQDFREQLESAWIFLSEPVPENSSGYPEEIKGATKLDEMAAYLASSNNGKEDLRALLAIVGTALATMNESERNDAIFNFHSDTIRSTLMLVRKIHVDRSGNKTQG